jgi:hypothetical protein
MVRTFGLARKLQGSSGRMLSTRKIWSTLLEFAVVHAAALDEVEGKKYQGYRNLCRTRWQTKCSHLSRG